MSVTGHYYVNNLVQFGSPVYPFVFKVGEFGFDGKLDYRNTSIIDNLDDKRLWDILLPSSVWRGGLIFPIILVFGTIGMIGLVSYLGFRYLKTKLIESKILYLSIFILITWLIFLNSFVSAGFTPSTFDHIQNLNSTRYAIATIILSEVFLIYVLYRIKIPELVLLGILGINVAFRLWLFYSNFPSYLESFVIILPVSVIVGVFVLQKFLKKSYQKTTLVILIGILLFYFSPEVIEFNRTAWLPWWYDVISVVHELPKSSIFIISDMDSGKDMPHRYPVYGKDFRHSLTIGTVNELIENINNNQKVPEYVVELCWKQYNCSTEFTQLSSKLVEYNYQTIARDGNNAILLKFSE